MTVKVDLTGIEKKLGQGNIKQARYAMLNQMLIDMQPFVPNDQGTLQQTGTMGVDGKSLHWMMPYAKAQFYGTNGKVVFSRYTTPGTGRRWDLRAKSLYMSDWQKVFVKGLGL